MQKTMYQLLTNKKVRKAKAVAALLKKELAAGAPWYDKASQGSLGSK